MERIGVCLACHQDIPDGTPTAKMLNELLKRTGRTPNTDAKHRALINAINRNASTDADRVHVLP